MAQIELDKQEFIEFCLKQNVLKFGNFVLKSGRKSPYFFNTGLIYNNTALKQLGEFYASLIFRNILSQHNTIDCIFGPAYKGITLATTTAIALNNNYQHSINIAFNRKEAKIHGEGGNIIGPDLSNKKVLIIDDVISAGTAARETINLLKENNANIIGMVVALDRQMTANNLNYSTARDEIAGEYNISIYSIITLNDLIDYTGNNLEYQEIYRLLTNDNN